MRENKEKWMELCRQAATEQDLEKLAVLILEINFMLEAKELRLKNAISRLPSTKRKKNNSVAVIRRTVSVCLSCKA